MPTPNITSIQVRRGTKAEWESANPQLLEGEIGLETNTYRMKIGRRDNFGELFFWNDLRYQAPFSGTEKPVYPQDGDFWVDATTEDLFYYDGSEWKKLGNTKSPNFEGNINVENACITGDLTPCADVTYKLGAPDKKWTELHMGEGPDDFEIKVGETTDPENIGGARRLQLNGDDIATRADFESIDTRSLDLWRSTNQDGSLSPIPNEYTEFVELETKNLPPQGNISSQAQYNEWLLASLLKIVGRDTDPAAVDMQFWNKSFFEVRMNAQKGLRTPISGNETDYNNAQEQSQYFHKADGSVSDRMPLNQSYWNDVPRL